nr:hypothetical protein [Ningiella sp. W23]
MYKIVDEPKANYIPIYIDTESADSEAEFWSKVFNALMEEDFIASLKTKTKNFWDKIKSIKIASITMDGVEFGDGKMLESQAGFSQIN